MADTNGPNDGAARIQAAAEKPRAKATKVTVETAVSGYANFCRVTGTPEEVILDFGLNSHPFGESDEPVPISHRIVVNHYTAKRMLAALQMAVGRHEQAFGPLEVDVRKRVAASQAAPAGDAE